MKKYRVTFEIVIDVEAEDVDDATEKADDMWAEGKFKLYPYIEEKGD